QDSPLGFPSPCPTLRLSPTFHRSLEGLNQELEEAFVKDQGEEELLRILDVPDGHRAPAPAQGGSRDSSLPLESGRSSCRSLSLSPSPGRPGAPAPSLEPQPQEKEGSSPSPLPDFASSPRPNHSCDFQREPPEGCERVRACGEAPSPSPSQPSQLSCPDRNKVHFSPSGSAFCPVALGKPLFPSMEFLFRGFPAPSSPGCFPCSRPAAPSPFLGLRRDAAEALGEASEAPGRNCEPWSCGQPEESVVFQSSLVA
ncbi:F117A protein, partial [Menura novaehollandiae]|nr:F117A protein [Menura novaehollandiae]